MKLLAAALLFVLSLCPLFADEPKAPAEADGPADHQGSRRVVAQAADGTATLHAKDASVHGATIRYEPAEHKNTVGYWSHAEDWVSWEFEITKPGKFDVEMLQGCGKGSGGSEVTVRIGEQELPMTVEDTGGFQNFVPRTIGAVTLPAGRHTISVKVKVKKGGAVMDLRQIVLKPAAK